MNPSTREPRLGFLGVGWIGLRRLTAIQESGAGIIAAVCDPVSANLQKAVDQAPEAIAVDRYDELLELELDGIVIATPSALHPEQTISALERGYAVFCQKPLGRNAEEVETMVATARRCNLLLGVDLSYRYTQGLRRIRELVQAGALGRVFSVDLTFHNAYGPQAAWFYDARLSGGGCVIDLGIHLVDAAIWILDSPVSSVSARVFSKGAALSASSIGVEDFALARIDLECGTAVNLTCSWRAHAGRDAVIEASFFGTEGGAAMKNVHGSFVDFKTERYSGIKAETLFEPPEAWGGLAAIEWTRRLQASSAFDPEIKRQVEVASILDAIYGQRSASLPAKLSL